MSTLHERLSAALVDDGNVKGCGECGQSHEAEAALRAVVELHAPVERVLLRGLPAECNVTECTACLEDGPAWPCSTITAIAEALGIGETP